MASTRRMMEGPVRGHLLAYALPLILGNLFQLTYNAVDTIVIGKFAGERALAAVSAADPVMTIVILGVSGISIGASVLMSRFFGAGEEEKLRREVATTMLFGAGASLVVFILGMLLSGTLSSRRMRPESSDNFSLFILASLIFLFSSLTVIFCTFGERISAILKRVYKSV